MTSLQTKNRVGKNGIKGAKFYISLPMTLGLKGNSGREKSYAQIKEREKCKRNEPSPTSMRQMVLEIFHFKVRNLGKVDIAIL